MRMRPVETGAGGAALKVLGIEQGRKGPRDSVEATFAGGLFLLLELVPAAEDLGRVAQLFPAKDMGVAADELFGQLPRHGLKIKGPALPGQLGVEENVQQDVSQFFFEGMVIALVDGFEKLVYLLQNHGPKRTVGLFPVPRAAPGPAQAGHDAGEGLGFTHRSGLRAPRRFVEPERDEFAPLVILTP